jgi:hypothetical protein
MYGQMQIEWVMIAPICSAKKSPPFIPERWFFRKFEKAKDCTEKAAIEACEEIRLWPMHALTE